MKPAIRIIAISVSVICLGIGLFFYNKYMRGTSVPSELENPYVFIPTNSSFEDVVQTLNDQSIIQDESVFRWLADYMKYEKDPMRAGHFKIKPGWSVVQLIRHLRNGNQEPMGVVLTNERLLEDVAAKTARFLESDSTAFIDYFLDEDQLNENGYTKETLMSLFIPNTYQMFWNTTPEGFIKRMVREHNNFWNQENRREKAKKLDLTEAEVYTLASIVEKETQQNQEKKRMAGVYYNRLQKGMRLQADPTVVFATRDFNTRRVLNRHLEVESPYNTYKYKGLPPGPIAMASISSLDAVLNLEDHDYIFFCAKGDGSGLHAFAKTLEGHNRNARNYRINLRKRGLR